MARYPKRQKVKRYRRSFYTREMRLKKGIGIAVLVVAVLAAGPSKVAGRAAIRG